MSSSSAEPGRTERAVVVFLHGGVWQLGDRSHYEALGRDLAAHGFVAFIASYRLAPKHRWPAQLDDARAVVALAVQEAPRFGGDPSRLIVMGHSAGGQLAALLADDPRVRALALFSGVFDLELPLDESQRDGGFRQFIAPVFAQDQLASASPLRTLQASPRPGARRWIKPTLLVTSERDYRAMHAQTIAMNAALRSLSPAPRVELVELPRVDHFEMVARVDDAMAAKLHALLR